MNVQRRTRPGALQNGKAGLSGKPAGANLCLAIMLFIKGKLSPRLQLIFAGSFDFVVEGRNQNTPGRVLQLRDNLCERDKWIRRGSAVHARMQVGLCAAYLNLGV